METGDYKQCNSSWNETTSDVMLLMETRFWIQRVLTPIVVIVGLIGNSVTIAVLTQHRMKSSTNIYLTALAVSDLLYLLCFFLMSLKHYSGMDSERYYLYWILLPWLHWPTDASSSTSIWLTVSFTFERYIAVCHPLRGRVLCTESRAKKVIFWVAVFSISATASTPFEWEVCYVQQNKLAIVNTDFGRDDYYTSIYYWFTAFVFVYIPLVILCVLNTLLIRAVQTSQKQRTGMMQVKNYTGNMHRERQENKITIALIAVVLLFIICQIPTTVWLIVDIFYKPPENSPGAHYKKALGNIFNCLMAINAATNFILYCVMSDKYRRTMMITFFPCWAKHRRTLTMSSIASFQTSMRSSVRPHSVYRSNRSSVRCSNGAGTVDGEFAAINCSTGHKATSADCNSYSMPTACQTENNRLCPPSVKY